jgi:hypothetical protein
MDYANYHVYFWEYFICKHVSNVKSHFYIFFCHSKYDELIKSLINIVN